MLSTKQLAHVVTNGSVMVEMDHEWFSYWGMTEQSNGDVLVHLRYTDTDASFDIEVARRDWFELLWSL